MSIPPRRDGSPRSSCSTASRSGPGYLTAPFAYYEAATEEELATLCRESLINLVILQAFVKANRDLCRGWPQALLRRRFYLVHLSCARRYFAASEIDTARDHFLEAWAWSPAQMSSLAYGLACLTGRGASGPSGRCTEGPRRRGRGVTRPPRQCFARSASAPTMAPPGWRGQAFTAAGSA